MTSTHRRRIPFLPPNRRTEKGASAVEFAIILPLVLFIVLGMVEFGTLIKSTNTVSNAANAGARVASVESRKESYHVNAKLAIEAVLNNAKIAAKKIVVYKADRTTGAPTNGGTPLVSKDYSTCTAECFIWKEFNGFYVWNNINDTTGNVPPTVRWPWWRMAACGTTSGTDYIGVWVEYDHRFITSLFGTSRTVRQRAIYRLEPIEYSNITDCNGTTRPSSVPSENDIQGYR
jgi:Flp pilus assembly protein TadG